MEVLLASNNIHKIKEIKAILPEYNIITLSDINFHDEIAEDGNTFYENALLKVKALEKIYNGNIIADDSGIEAYALDNKPGVHSKRYSCLGTDLANNNKLIHELKNKDNKKARYVCSIVMKYNDNYYHFEGFLEGIVIDNPRGNNGFGYDPIFLLPNYNKTVAELKDEEKNLISHRSQALIELKKFFYNKDIIS